jgi:lipoprotein-releasing system permease protein
LNFPLYIAKRYLVSKSGNNAINIITLLATLLVIVVTSVFFILLSGFSGLKNFSLAFYQAADPDIKITATEGKTFLFTEALGEQLQDEAIVAFSRVLEERAFFNYNNKEHIAYIKGVDRHYTQVVRMDTTVIVGNWLHTQDLYGVVVGNAIANKLSMGIDFIEPLTVYVPKQGNTFNPDISSMVNSVRTQSIGIFAIIDDIDSKYVYAYLPVVQELLQYPLNRVSAVSIKLKEGTNPALFATELQERLGHKFKVKTRAQLNAVFYKMLNSENLLLYFISTLLLIMALFNIIGTLIMMIIDKKSNLKTLLSLGSTIKDLRQVFVYQGFLLTLFGLLVGLFIGVVLVYLQSHYHFVKINANLAYPVLFQFKNVVIVALTIIVLGYLSAYIASSRINDRLLDEN